MAAHDGSDFERSLKDSTPPSDLTRELLALWHNARGNWDQAHRVAQDIAGPNGAWIHAYLHRKEGDAGNAGYWYRHANRPSSHATLDEEWRELVDHFLEQWR